MKIFDPTFGIRPQAYAVAHLLNVYDSSEFLGNEVYDDKEFSRNCEIKSYPFYNGREMGIILEARHFLSDRAYYVNFGEHRNSDNLFVQETRKRPSFNNPGLDIFDDSDYNKRTFFKYGQYNETVQYIVDGIRAFFIVEHSEWKTRKASRTKA